MKEFHKRKREDDSNQSKKNISNFLQKLYQILESNEYQDIIQWCQNGEDFIVKNIQEFTNTILPHFFKHNNFHSFIRQLNNYDFHKKRNIGTQQIFHHPQFIHGNQNLLRAIKRKDPVRPKVITPEKEEMALINLYSNNFISLKKITKNHLAGAFSLLSRILSETKEKHYNMEKKITLLQQEIDEYVALNQQILQKLIRKTDYTEQLERLLFSIIHLVFPMCTYKGVDTSTSSSNLNTSKLTKVIAPRTYGIQNCFISVNPEKLGDNSNANTNLLKYDEYANFKNFLEKYEEYFNKVNSLKSLERIDKPASFSECSDPIFQINKTNSPNPFIFPEKELCGLSLSQCNSLHFDQDEEDQKEKDNNEYFPIKQNEDYTSKYSPNNGFVFEWEDSPLFSHSKEMPIERCQGK